MCQTTISDIDDMSEISSASHKKTGKLIEPRKIRKPLMEKKRRARINQSLDELKRIVVDAQKIAGQDLSRVNKLEKADILEMTVRYLKRKATPPADVYTAGYRQCIEQVQELLAEQWTDERRRQSGRRMVEHLETCVRRLNVPPPPPSPSKDRLSSTASSSSCCLSADDSADEQELLSAETPNVVAATAACPPSPAAAAAAITTANHHTMEFQNIHPPKTTWRPW